MAIVYGVNYQKMYIDDLKELGSAGLQHTKMRVLADNATAATSDQVFIGELPDEAILLSGEVVGSAVTLTFEDEAGNVIAIGDKVSSRTKLVCIPSGALAGELLLVKYIQA